MQTRSWRGRVLLSKVLPDRSPFSCSPRDPFLPRARPWCSLMVPEPYLAHPFPPVSCPPTHSPGSHHLARLRAQLPHHAGALRPQPALAAHAAPGAGASRGRPGGLRGGGGLAHGQHRADPHSRAHSHLPLEQAQRPGARAAHLGHGRRLGAISRNAAGGRRLHRGRRGRCGNAAGRRSRPGTHRGRAGGRPRLRQRRRLRCDSHSGTGFHPPPGSAPTSGQRVTSRDAERVRRGRPRVNKPTQGPRGAAAAMGTGRVAGPSRGAGPGGNSVATPCVPCEHRVPACNTRHSATTPSKR